jgi:hypothetical protein
MVRWHEVAAKYGYFGMAELRVAVAAISHVRVGIESGYPQVSSQLDSETRIGRAN